MIIALIIIAAAYLAYRGGYICLDGTCQNGCGCSLDKNGDGKADSLQKGGRPKGSKNKGGPET